MANYCPNCGNSVSSNDSFCPNCGAALASGGAANGNANATSTGTNNTAGTVLGTLVAVTLLGGMTRNLYYYGGRYFLDPYCRRPFHGSIMGPHRMVGGPHPHGGMGGPHGGMHGGMHGGPHGGGPHGR